MRYCFILLILLVPAISQAQFYNAENYNPGDQLHYMVCTMPASPGSAGYSIIWNFHSVQDSGNGQHTTWVLDDTSTAANSDIILSPSPIPDNGSRIMKTATKTYLTEFHAAPLKYTYDPGALVVSAAISYGFTDSNSFTSKLYVPGDTLSGGGTSNILVDGIGTVKTPVGTFNNALRIKRTVDNYDSVPGGSIRNLLVSYLWYDSLHTAPLFRIDSVYRTGTGPFQNATTVTATAQYLQIIFPASIENIAQGAKSALGHLDDKGLLINAQLSHGKQYRLALVNISGQELYNCTFAAESELQKFKLPAQVPAGNYIVIITSITEPGTPTVIRLVKD